MKFNLNAYKAGILALIKMILLIFGLIITTLTLIICYLFIGFEFMQKPLNKLGDLLESIIDL